MEKVPESSVGKEVMTDTQSSQTEKKPNYLRCPKCNQVLGEIADQLVGDISIKCSKCSSFRKEVYVRFVVIFMPNSSDDKI